MNCLIYNLTDACTMRCAYCIYSGRYKFQKKHGDTKNPKSYMKESVALEALSYFLNESIEKKSISIGFYNESLMNYNIIKKITSEVLVKSNGKKIKLMITTNGLSLKSEIADFLIKNNFKILVSLDGPKDIHDKNRVNLNKKGTWNSITENLNRLYHINNDFYKKNIIFQATLTDYKNILKINSFFSENKLTKSNRIIARLVKNNDLNDINTNLLTDEIEDNAYDFFLDEFEKLNFKKIKLLISLWGYSLNKIYIKRKKGVIKNSICFPGNRKIYVDLDGSIKICEKNCSIIPIGHISSGINHKTVKCITDSYNIEREKKCTECKIQGYCECCYDVIHEGYNLSRLKEFCLNERKKWHDYFTLYQYILDRNPDAIDVLFKQISYDYNSARCGF